MQEGAIDPHQSVGLRSQHSGATDAFIAAVALANGFTVATRDTSPFEAAGVPTIDPWKGF